MKRLTIAATVILAALALLLSGCAVATAAANAYAIPRLCVSPYPAPAGSRCAERAARERARAECFTEEPGGGPE